MPREGLPDYLALRIVNNLTGDEIVHELAHAHDTKWEVRALQQGMPGSSTLGTFTIHSPGGPMSDEMRRHWKDQWTQLAIGQRVEGYLGNVVAGSPRFTGVVTGMKRPLDAPWEITGVDSLWMLQQSQVLPGETILQPGPVSTSLQAFTGTQECVWDDDFTGWNATTHPNSSDYTNTGSHWSFTSSDPVLGLPALTSSFVGEANLTTTTSWHSEQQYQACTISVHGVLNAGTSTTNAGQVGVWFEADATAQNGTLVAFTMAQTGVGTGAYNVSVTIFSRSGGVYTSQAAVANVFTNVGPQFPFELTAVICMVATGPNAFNCTVRLLINGKDPNCFWGGLSQFGAQGRIGILFAPEPGGSPAAYVNRIQFHGRTSSSFGTFWGTDRFAFKERIAGLVSPTDSVNGNGQTHLDMLVLGMTFDGAFIRKNPGAGYKSDTLSYGTTAGLGSFNPGTDYSSSIVLEEGGNIVASGTEAAAVAEMLAADVRLNALPGGNSGGSVTWGRIAAVGDAILTDTVADVGLAGFGLMVTYARQIQGRKVNPFQAVQVRVVRDPKWLSVNNGAGPRELDTVGVKIPSLNVPLQAQVIQGYDFEEGQGTMLVYLSQLPARAAPAHIIQRIQRPLDYLGTTYAPR